MIPYGNNAGNSGVVAYEIGTDQIAVKFVDGMVYTYTNTSAGAKAINQMKALAKRGSGLSTFISTTVKHKYARKSG